MPFLVRQKISYEIMRVCSAAQNKRCAEEEGNDDCLRSKMRSTSIDEVVRLREKIGQTSKKRSRGD